MARRTNPAERPRHGVLGRYLLDGERLLTAVHQHWAKVAEPVASVVAGLVLVLALDSTLPATLGIVANLLWWAWFVVVARALWRILEWRHDWFVATDKRLILTYGLITQKVAMMPLAKVTDMSYNRSPLGRLLGYGTFVMESAGLDQALRRVRWVDNPDHTYRVICAEIFGVEDRERVVDGDEHDHRFEDGAPPHTPGLYAEYAPPGGQSTSSDSRQESKQPDSSAEIPIRYGRSPKGEPDTWFQSPDLRDPALREADTGPIPYRRPATDDGGGWLPTTNDRDQGRSGDNDRDLDKDRDRDKSHHRDRDKKRDRDLHD